MEAEGDGRHAVLSRAPQGERRALGLLRAPRLRLATAPRRPPPLPASSPTTGPTERRPRGPKDKHRHLIGSAGPAGCYGEAGAVSLFPFSFFSKSRFPAVCRGRGDGDWKDWKVICLMCLKLEADRMKV